MSKQKEYSASVKRLRAFLKEKEESRQKWAREKWIHTDGRLFKFGRAFVPIVGFIGFCAMFVVCLIRWANIPSVNRWLLDYNNQTTNTTAREDVLIWPFLILSAVALVLLVVIAVRFIIGKYRANAGMLLGVSCYLSFGSILRYFADQGTFPDNSTSELGSTYTYYEYCIFACVVFAVLLVYSIMLLTITVKDKREFNRIVDNTIVKITKDNSDLLTEDDYSRLIDEYIDESIEKESLGMLSKKEAKKRKKELLMKKEK